MSYIKTAQDIFTAEINAIKNVANSLDNSFEQAIDFILKNNKKIIVTGLGKSGLIGRKIAATLASTGTPAIFMHPTEAYHGDLGIIEQQEVIIAISFSGETDEIIRLFSFFKENQNKIIAISGNKNSTLAKYSDFSFVLDINKEACPLELAPSSSTSATLVLGDALAFTLMKAKNFTQSDFAKYHPGGSLGKKLLLKVKDKMHKNNLPTIDKNADFFSLLSVMSNSNFGLVIIVEKKQAIGIITDGDLKRALLQHKNNINAIVANSIMTTNPKTITKEESLNNTTKFMQKHQISAVLVTKNKELCGIIQLHQCEI